MESINVNQQLAKTKLSPEEIERIKNNKVTVNLGLRINLDNLQEYSNIRYFGVNNRYPKRNVQIKHAPSKKHLVPSEFSGPFDMNFICSENPPPPIKRRRRKRKVEVVETTVSCLDNNQIKKRKLQVVEKTTESNKNYDFASIKIMKRLCKMIKITKFDSHHLIRRILFTTDFLSVINYDQKKNKVVSYPILLDKLFTTINKNQLSFMQPFSHSSVIIIKNKMKKKINQMNINKAALTNDLKNNSSSSVNAGFLPRIEHDYKTGELSEDINRNKLLCNVIRGGQNNVFDFSDVKFISDLIKGNNESPINITALIEKKLYTHSNNSVSDNGDAQHSKEVSIISCGSEINSRPSVRDITKGTTVVVDSELLNSFPKKISTDYMIDKNMLSKLLQSQFKFTPTTGYRKLIEYEYRMMAYTRIPSTISTNYVLKYPDKTDMPMCSLDMHLKHNLDILNDHTRVANEQKSDHHGIEFNYVQLMKSAIPLDVGEIDCNSMSQEMKIAKKISSYPNCISFKIISPNKKHKNIYQIIEKAIYCAQTIYCTRDNMKFASNTIIIKKSRKLYIVMYDKMRGVLDLENETISSSDESKINSKLSHFLQNIKKRFFATEEDIYDVEAYDLETLLDDEDGQINDISALFSKDFNIDFIDLTNNDDILPCYYLKNKTKTNICDIMIRIMKTNYSFFKFRLMCNNSLEIKSALRKASLPTKLENIIELDIVPFVKIYLKWFDDECLKSMQFDRSGIAILKTMISFLKETNPTIINLATNVINNSLSTLYSYRYETFSKPNQPSKMNLTTDNDSENNCNDEAEKVNNSMSLIVDDPQLCVKTDWVNDFADIIDNDRILKNIKVKSIIVSSSVIVDLVDDTSYDDNEIVMCDISKFNFLGMFKPNLVKSLDYFNKNYHCSIDFIESDIFKSIPDINIYDDTSMDDDAQSVNQILDVNFDFHNFKTEEESSLLSACEQLFNLPIFDINTTSDDLDVRDKSSSIIDLPLGFDNAGTLLPE